MDQYQIKYPVLMGKINCAAYKCSYIGERYNNNFNLITCEDKISDL